MATSQAGPSTIANLPHGQNLDSSFFRALSAPAVAPLLPVNLEAPMPRVGDPQVPQGLKPLEWPLHTSTGEWAWLNGKTFYDIHDLVTLHDDELHTMTIRACRVGDRTLTYLNKSWKISSRHPGAMSELYLYKTALNHLMGECVPNLISVRSGPDTFNLGFELPNQPFFIEPSADMPDALKRRTIKTLEKLHAEGVCHKGLNLDNIMIGADGKIYIYNFHYARYINEKPPLHLLEATEFDFALELRRLKFKLDYENAREKEKKRLADVVNRERRNDIELKKARDNPFYRPRIIKPGRDEALVPPLDLSRFEGWFSDLDREPRKFIMPGQRAEDFERALKDFHNVLRLMEVEDEKLLTAASQQSRTLKRKRSRGSEEGSPSGKRLRRPSQHLQSSENATETNPTEPKAFKNDDRRSPSISLVSSREVHSSIQTNNLISEWPIVVIRDFVKEPPPKVGNRLKALSERLRGEAAKEQEEKRRMLEEENAVASLGRLRGALRYLYSLHGNRQQEPTRTVKRTPLRRHETFFYEDPSPSTHNVGTWSTGPSTSTQPESVHPQPSQIEMGWRDNTFPHSVAAPLQAIQRLFTEITRPMSL